MMRRAELVPVEPVNGRVRPERDEPKRMRAQKEEQGQIRKADIPKRHRDVPSEKKHGTSVTTPISLSHPLKDDRVTR